MDVNAIKSSQITSFKSKISFINAKEFVARTGQLNKQRSEVSYPWTIETMKVGKDLFTTGLMDCIGGCIISNNSAAMFHLATRTPTEAIKDNVLPFDIQNIEKFFNSKLNLNKNNNSHGIILGGLQSDNNPNSYNVKCFNELLDLFKKKNIDCTIFGPRKVLHYFGKYSILYENKQDILYITNSLTNATDLRGKGKEIEFIRPNLLNYNTYEEIRDNNKRLLEYRTHKQLTNIPEFFKTQFYNTTLSKFDEWG